MDHTLTQDQLFHLIAKQESKIDMLEAELGYLNQLLKRVGFPDGIETLKSSAEELLEENADS